MASPKQSVDIEMIENCPHHSSTLTEGELLVEKRSALPPFVTLFHSDADFLFCADLFERLISGFSPSQYLSTFFATWTDRILVKISETKKAN
jgi:hypothetical protein